MDDISKPPVLIAGAGPTGLLLALWFIKFSIPFRLVDRAPAVANTSRAMVVHARTIELYRQLGFADEIVAEGVKIKRLAIHHSRVEQGAVTLSEAGRGLSKYPFILSLQQDKHEAILQRILEQRGGKVERGVEMVGLVQREDDGNVEVTLRQANGGKEETFLASYVAGADGAHSAVRTAAGIKMEGGTYDKRLFVADVDIAETTLREDDINMCLSNEDFAMVIPLSGTDRARLVGFVPPELQNAERVDYEDVVPSVERNTSVKVQKVNWFSFYRVHHLFALQFRLGNVFLLGDAAHLHSPTGGQGMNTGLGDATNLAWKLAAVYKGKTTPELLDSYDTERRGFAKVLVNTTDKTFSLLTGPGYISRFLRNWLLPIIIPVVFGNMGNIVGRTMFKRTSQIELAYPDSALSKNIGPNANGAGGRLPWLEYTAEQGAIEDNFASLTKNTWQGHVYGDIPDSLMQKLREHNIPINSFPWSSEVSRAGLVQDTLYLVRPDGYIGFMMKCTSALVNSAALQEYIEQWGLSASAE